MKSLLIIMLLAIPVAAQCDRSQVSALQKRVYHSKRLVPTKLGCITVTGKVIAVRREADAARHILLMLDDDGTATGAAQILSLLNSVNMTKQKGCLVVEPICVDKKVRQKDAIAACKGYVNRVTIPRVGDHVAVSGVHVLDKQHGHMELHPVSQISVIP